MSELWWLEVGTNPKQWLDLAASLFDDIGRVEIEPVNGYTSYRFETRGSSHNQSVIDAMMENSMLWSLTWYMTIKGGIYQFKLYDGSVAHQVVMIPKLPLKPVMEFAVAA